MPGYKNIYGNQKYVRFVDNLNKLTKTSDKYRDVATISNRANCSYHLMSKLCEGKLNVASLVAPYRRIDRPAPRDGPNMFTYDHLTEQQR